MSFFERLDRVEDARDQVRPVASGEVGDEVVHLLLRQRAVHEREVVEISLAVVERLLEGPLDLQREDDAARCGQPDLVRALAVLDRVLELDLVGLERVLDLFLGLEALEAL